MQPPSQLELLLTSSSGPSPSDGVAAWRNERDAAARQAASDLGMPIGRPVEIWLRGGIRLRGVLRLHESVLIVEERGAWKLQLAIDNTPFRPDEVESCVRLD